MGQQWPERWIFYHGLYFSILGVHPAKTETAVSNFVPSA
jgi:hypothetical protein